MAQLGRWTGGTIGTMVPGTSWAAPNGLFPTQARNDGSAYSFASATSTLTLPSSGLADGYLIKARVETEDSSNGRYNNQGKFVQTGGTGTFVTAQAGGYSRDNSEDRAWISVWCFIDNPSASATIQFQWKRDTDAPNTSDGTVNSALEVIPFYYADIGLYSSTTAANYGGTTANQVTGFSGTDGTNITMTSNVVTVTGDNKRYLILGGYYMENHSNGTRTQRWAGLEIDSAVEDAAKAYAYWRQASCDQNGMTFEWLIETVTASRTIEMFAFRGYQVTAPADGANSDGAGTESGAAHALVVMELNDSAEVFQSVDETGNQEIALTGPVDLNLFRTTDINFNDSASWTRASDTAMNAEKAMDAYIAANVTACQETVSNGTRFSCRAHITVNGTEDDATRHGNYMRSNQSSADTFGWSAHPSGFVALSIGDDVGASAQELAGTEGGGGNIEVNGGWCGIIGINLDTLEASAAIEADSADGADIGDTATAVLKAEATATDGVDLTDTPAGEFPHDFRLSLSTQFADGAATTVQLTAPSGKTTADFDAGKIHESSNPADSINITADDYTEIEFCFEATDAAADVQYDFRIEGLDTYTVTPQLTISSSIQATATDGIKMTDTPSPAAKLTAAVTDGLDMGETDSGAGTFPKTVTDGAELSETLARIKKAIATATDGTELGEALSALLKLSATAADGTELSETLSRVAIRPGAASDGVELGDDPANIYTGTAAPTDGLEASDTPAGVYTTSQSVTDGFELSEVLDGAIKILASATDGIEMAESLVTVSKLVSSITSGIELSETLALRGDWVMSLTDGAKLSETLTGDVSGVLEATALDGIEMTDDPSVVATYPVTATDGLTLSEAFVIAATFVLAAADGAQLGEVLTGDVLGAIEALATDGLEIGDTPSPAVTWLISAADGLELSDSPAVQKFLDGLAVDGFDFADVSAATLKLVVTAGDGVKLGEILARGLRLAALVTDGFTMGEIVSWEIAEGMITVTFSARKATVQLSLKVPEISFTSRKPGVSATGRKPAATMTGKKPKVTLH